MSQLSIEDVTVRFGRGAEAVVALDSLSLDVAQGELVVLLGPSGCGKSTALNCVAGLVEPTSGTITFHGKDIFALSRSERDEYRRNVQPVFQDPYAIFNPIYRVDRVLWTTLTVASLLAALGGLLITGRLASVAAAQGNGAIFTVFAAAVIGGVSLNGGRGTIFGAFTGILLLYLIQNVLTLAGVPAQWIDALNGTIILLALIVSRITSGQAQDT